MALIFTEEDPSPILRWGWSNKTSQIFDMRKMRTLDPLYLEKDSIMESKAPIVSSPMKLGSIKYLFSTELHWRADFGIILWSFFL